MLSNYKFQGSKLINEQQQQKNKKPYNQKPYNASQKSDERVN